MSAIHIIANAALGSIVSWSDGTPKPPERFTKKLAKWRNNNSCGRLIRKTGESTVGNFPMPACFTLHEQDFGSRGVIVLRVHRTFDADSTLCFSIVERPSIGLVLVLSRSGDDGELLYIAADRRDAEDWLTQHRYPDAILREVTPDDTTADIEGRVA